MDDKLFLAEGSFDGCFGCGDTNPVGLRLVFEREGDTVRSRTRITAHYAGYRQFVHGGVVATMLDEAMGWAMLHVAGHHGVTKSLRVTYRRPVRIDREIRVAASVAGRTGTTIRMASWIDDDLGRRLASAEAEWVIVRGERAAGRR